MCCCGKPTINGEPGYSWDGKSLGIRPVHAPQLAETDELVYDEPGRCGGLDCHAHHFRLVKNPYGHTILVAHGGGEERVALGCIGKLMVPSLAALDSNARYWLLRTIYSTRSDAELCARQERDAVWRKAAAEGRIKTRRNRNRGTVKVWIEPAMEMKDPIAA